MTGTDPAEAGSDKAECSLGDRIDVLNRILIDIRESLDGIIGIESRDRAERTKPDTILEGLEEAIEEAIWKAQGISGQVVRMGKRL